jgi:hypothetical protein
MKTQKTKASVQAFVAAITDAQRKKDCKAVIGMMKKATGEAPAMWGTSIVGFGKYHYKYPSGREGDFLITGLSPRKDSLTLYITPGFSQYRDLLAKLGKYKLGKSCLYIKKLDDVDVPTLEQLITQSVADMRERYASS